MSKDNSHPNSQDNSHGGKRVRLTGTGQTKRELSPVKSASSKPSCSTSLQSRHEQAAPKDVPAPPPPKPTTLDEVVHLLQKRRKIMVLTGAGISVSCGIPDFRSKNGLYAQVDKNYDLPTPESMFDVRYFGRNPKPFFDFAKNILPGKLKPSTTHHFIKLIEEKNKLLRNYTQNVDQLEQVAGISNVVQCHGSFATATCMMCKKKVMLNDFRQDIENQVIPRCPQCPGEVENAIMKPDIVFFGEALPDKFHNNIKEDKDECDLLIVIGTSLKIKPVKEIPDGIPAHIPKILINREPLKNFNFDVELLGDSDVIVNELCHRLGQDWEKLAGSFPACSERVASVEELARKHGPQFQNVEDGTYYKVNPNCYVFRGANVKKDYLRKCPTRLSARLTPTSPLKRRTVTTPSRYKD